MSRRVGHAATLAAGASAVLLCSLLAEAAAAKPLQVRRLVVHPRAGKKLPARPVKIRIRAGRHARPGAKLNGRPIAGRLSRPSRRGVRTLVASPSHGLRHGRNVLWVRVLRPGEKRARVQRVRFRVARNRPLSAAGLDRRVGLHSHLAADGRRSLPRPDGGGQPLRFRWRLVRAPRGSQLSRFVKGAASGRRQVRNFGPRPRFRRRRTARSALRFDHPGIYRLRLTVIGPDGRRGIDGVTLRVDPPPLVPIDTMAKPAKQRYWGVQVGDAFYPDRGKNAQWLQIVLLKATTQELVWNRSYDCPAATAHPKVTEGKAVQGCIDRVHADISKAKQASGGTALLAFVASQRTDGKIARTKPWQAQPPVGYFWAVGQLGPDPIEAETFFEHTGTALLRGRMSMVGRIGPRYPHTVVTRTEYDLDDLRFPGEVKGFLVRDNLGRYGGFASPEHVPFETQAAGSTATLNVMRIGSGRYRSDSPEPIGAGEGGLQVTMVDPLSLGGATRMFRTRVAGCGESCIPAELAEMVKWIEGQVKGGRTLLFLASVGNPLVDPGNTQAGDKAAVNRAATAVVDLLVDHFGATANRVFRALTDTGIGPTQYPRSYTLVASYLTPPGRGQELEGPPVGGKNGVPTSGSLTPSPYGFRYRVEPGIAGPERGDAGAKLREVAFSEPGAWPEQGNRGRVAAIISVGGKVGIDGRRSLYWTQPYTDGFWDAKRERIAELRYPSKARFSRADFGWAKSELGLEIRWLKSAHGYASILAQPFSKGQLTAWSDVARVAARIEALVRPPAPTSTKFELQLGILLGFFRHFGEAIPGAGDAVAAVGAAYDAILEVVELDEGEEYAGDAFSVTVAEAGARLAKRLAKVQETLEDQLVDVIAADYAKLRTVGICSELEQSCPDKPLSQWQFTQVDQAKAAPIVEDGTESFLYSALLPAKYDAWALPASGYTKTNAGYGHQAAGQTASGFWCAFHGLPQSAQLPYPISGNVAGQARVDNSYSVIAYAHRRGSGTLSKPWRMELPRPGVTDPLFRPRGEGGLGVDPEVFFRTAWPRGPTRFDHFPEWPSRTLWITKTKPFGLKNNCGWAAASAQG